VCSRQPENREWWGEQYQSLDKFGFQMVWQDMMCPAVVGSIMKTLPLYIRQYDFGK
jgi:alpha-glucosidase (family GH31 glycosyl hydrolase)